MSSRDPERDGVPDDDVDARFYALIKDQFGENSAASRSVAPRSRRASEPDARPEPTPEPFSFDEAFERAVPDDDPYIPPPVPPMRPWRTRVVVGAVLLALSLVTAIVTALGVPVPREVGYVAAAGGTIGLAVLLLSLPRAPRDRDDDGAQV